VVTPLVSNEVLAVSGSLTVSSYISVSQMGQLLISSFFNLSQGSFLEITTRSGINSITVQGDLYVDPKASLIFVGISDVAPISAVGCAHLSGNLSIDLTNVPFKTGLVAMNLLEYSSSPQCPNRGRFNSINVLLPEGYCSSAVRADYLSSKLVVSFTISECVVASVPASATLSTFTFLIPVIFLS
jgi:hypothetical protein